MIESMECSIPGEWAGVKLPPVWGRDGFEVKINRRARDAETIGFTMVDVRL